MLVVPDAGPLNSLWVVNSLWVADRLDVLLLLDMPIVIVDAVYEEVTSDPSYLKDAEVKAFIHDNSPPFVVESTFVGTLERQRRQPGTPRRRNIGELAMMDFISAEGGVQRYLETGDPVLVLTHPSAKGRRPEHARAFRDLPDGIDEPAKAAGAWSPR